MTTQAGLDTEFPLAGAGPAPKALLLCGGGSRGAMEVGFYQALTEYGVQPDLILSSSIGALNGAYIAGGMTPRQLIELWRDFELRRAVSVNWAWLRRGRRSAGLLGLDPLRAMLRRTLPTTRFEQLAIPLTIVTTDLQSGSACYWSGQGDLIEPLIASMSLPGIFSPVELGGRPHVDGGLANDVPFAKAEELGARAAYMIECACVQRCPRPLRGWADILMRSFSIALAGKYAAEREHFHGRLEVFLVRPQLAEEIDLLDFRHSAELIEVSYNQTRGLLQRRQVGEQGSLP
ncbi:MAG: hypothetical protein EPN70_20830 [Paraburkholderia sp.]|uniref:patatin-like phospholipase family protein n=1 Tax=Paraburkholderia sp. TaxID=1926495 RepID=UPI0011FFE142|nr:patatin-like phospholipase family protein [Paraburkholderia sp.]TAM00976.1 MAG: hypothetical protein EPN70_20830 [Paraburkholderia sp.]